MKKLIALLLSAALCLSLLAGCGSKTANNDAPDAGNSGELREMDVVLDFNIGFNTAELVRGGLGAAMIFIREMEEHAGLCCRPLEPELHSGSIIGWKKGQHLAPVMEEFVAMAKKCI